VAPEVEFVGASFDYGDEGASSRKSAWDPTGAKKWEAEHQDYGEDGPITRAQAEKAARDHRLYDYDAPGNSGVGRDAEKKTPEEEKTPEKTPDAIRGAAKVALEKGGAAGGHTGHVVSGRRWLP
jgi:hypothetical protein